MKITRRDFLKVAGLVAAVPILPQRQMTRAEVDGHLLVMQDDFTDTNDLPLENHIIAPVNVAGISQTYTRVRIGKGVLSTGQFAINSNMASSKTTGNGVAGGFIADTGVMDCLMMSDFYTGENFGYHVNFGLFHYIDNNNHWHVYGRVGSPDGYIRLVERVDSVSYIRQEVNVVTPTNTWMNVRILLTGNNVLMETPIWSVSYSTPTIKRSTKHGFVLFPTWEPNRFTFLDNWKVFSLEHVF